MSSVYYAQREKSRKSADTCASRQFMFRHETVLRPADVGIACLTAISLWMCGCASTDLPPAPMPYRDAVEVKSEEPVAPERLPRAMLLIEEKSLGTIPTAEVEALASSLLLQRGVEVVDQEMVRANVGKSQQLMKGVGDNYGATALGLQFGADVVVVGEAVAKPSARRIADSNLRTYQAVVTLRAVRADNSRTIASTSKDHSAFAVDDVAGSSQVLKAAGQKAFDDLIPAMLKSWSAGSPSAGASDGLNHVVLTIGGVDQAWKVQKIREHLKAMTGKARNVSQRSYTSGVMILELDSSIPAEELSEALVLEPPDKLRFQVLEVIPGAISLRAVAQ